MDAEIGKPPEGTEPRNIKEDMTNLALQRAQAEKMKEEIRLKQDEFYAQNKALFDERKRVEEEMLKTEAAIRTWALEKYTATKEKNLDYGIKVKTFTRIEYEPKMAYAWAVDHKLALKLDEKAFEAIAKKSPIEFVKITEEPKATIPTEIKIEEEKKPEETN